MNLVINYRNNQAQLLRDLAELAEATGNIRLRNAWLRMARRKGGNAN